MLTFIPEIKLTSTNYYAWKTHISFIFHFKHLLTIATDSTSKLDASASQDEQDKWNLKNEEALGLIGISMSPELYVHIGTCTYAFESWDKLKTIYASSNESRKIQLQDQLEDLRYIDFKSMDEFLLKFDALNSQLIALGVTLADIRLIHLVLKKCLLRQFQQFITNIHAQLALPSLASQLTYDIFQNLLRQEEAKLIQFGTLKSNEHAFFSNHKKNSRHNSKPNYNNNKPNYHNNGNDSRKFNSSSSNDSRKFNSSKRPHCTYCDKDGHWQNTCFKKKKEKRPRNQNKSNNNRSHNNSNQSRHAFTCCFQASKPLEWVIDSGASQHVTSHKEIFECMQPDFSNVPLQLANNHSCKV